MFRCMRDRRGAALVEYGLVIAGVALVAAAAVSVFGVKTNGLISSIGSALPGAHEDDNGALVSGRYLETSQRGTSTSAGQTGPIVVDVLDAVEGGKRLPDSLGLPIDMLLIDSGTAPGPGSLSR